MHTASPRRQGILVDCSETGLIHLPPHRKLALTRVQTTKVIWEQVGAVYPSDHIANLAGGAMRWKA